MKSLISSAIVGVTLMCTGQSTSIISNRSNVQDLHSKAASVHDLQEKTALPEAWNNVHTLQEITADSSVAVVVDVLSNRCELASQGTAIFTRYKARVIEVVRDNLFDKEKLPHDKKISSQANDGRKLIGIGDTIEIAFAGGKIRFEDGTTAQVDVVNLPRIRNDHRYLLYLNYTSSLKAYVPVHLSKGIFEVQGDQSNLHWLGMERTEKGYMIQRENFSENLAKARTEGIRAQSK